MNVDEGMRLVIAGVAEILLGVECLAIRFPTTGAIVRWPGRRSF